MRTLTIDHKNGHSTTYQLIEDGNNLPIAYNVETSEKVINALERARKSNQRIKIYYGDIETGRDWHEENDVTGYVGLSRGREARFPILVNNSRSMGGRSILDHRIIRIKESKGSYELYKAANYQTSTIEIIPSDKPEYKFNVNIDGKLYSRHKSERSAKLLKNKLS